MKRNRTIVMKVLPPIALAIVMTVAGPVFASLYRAPEKPPVHLANHSEFFKNMPDPVISR